MVFRRTGLLLGFALLFIYQLSAQQKMINYDKQWKKVDSLAGKKGLTQSALTEVGNIYALAKKEKNDAQVIKALVYQVSLQQAVTEEADNKSIALLEKEISNSAAPAKSILQTILAERYQSYFQQHRWQLYDRSQTINFKKDDIATWSAADFHAKIAEAYLASLKEEKLLKQTKLEIFDAIIIKGNARNLRPTLYVLLSHRALAYF